MRKIALLFSLCAIAAVASADITINGADPAAAWGTWMNVSETPANGGAYLWGSSWGAADLVATFDGGGVLTLAPNSINDPSPYWYLPAGGPGSTGNKIMEANFYQSFDGLAGQNVTFNFTVGSNTLTAAHTAVAFIKTFNAGWGLEQIQTVNLLPGAGSVTLQANAATNVTQVGFMFTGVPVWITDVAQYGTVTIVPEPATMGLLALGGLLLRRRK